MSFVSLVSFSSLLRGMIVFFKLIDFVGSKNDLISVERMLNKIPPPPPTEGGGATLR